MRFIQLVESVTFSFIKAMMSVESNVTKWVLKKNICWHQPTIFCLTKINNYIIISALEAPKKGMRKIKLEVRLQTSFQAPHE
jgi:hypothetical protein